MRDPSVQWAGVGFHVLHHRDGRMFHTPGLFAFVSRLQGDALMLFAGHADDLAQSAGPGHARWAEALSLGLNELHVSFPIPLRVDRLQLLSRIVIRVQPVLNVIDEAFPAPRALWSQSRSVG